MTNHEKTATPSDPDLTLSRSGRFDPVLGRIDLVAALTTLLGALLLGIAVAVFTLIQLVRLISSIYADDVGRWLLVALALAIVWVVARGRRLCIF